MKRVRLHSVLRYLIVGVAVFLFLLAFFFLLCFAVVAFPAGLISLIQFDESIILAVFSHKCISAILLLSALISLGCTMYAIFCVD